MSYIFIASVLIWAMTSVSASAQSPNWGQLIKTGDTLDRSGNYQEAALAYETALRLASAFPPSDRRISLTLDKLAMNYDESGRFADAISLYRRALAGVERWLGRNTEDYTALLNNLAAVYVEQGEFFGAEPLIRQALAIEETLLQSDDPRLAQARSILADVLIKRGKYKESAALLEQAIQVFADRPDCRRDLGIALNNLGVVRRFQKQPEESRRVLEEALATMESDTGPGHPILAKVLNNLGDAYAALGLRDQAEAAFRQSIEIAEARLGPEHPQYGVMLHNYAGFLRSIGRKPEAKSLEARSRIVIQESVRRNGVGMTVDVSAFRR